MSAAFAGPGALGSRGTRQSPRGRLTRRSRWLRIAPWVAPLLTASLLAACTYLMFASHGALLI
ncbi:MAG: hypothetical protein ACLPTM_08095 [Steroidobacteraceae bacterium]